jgi:hypothetical protein
MGTIRRFLSLAMPRGQCPCASNVLRADLDARVPPKYSGTRNVVAAATARRFIAYLANGMN